MQHHPGATKRTSDKLVRNTLRAVQEDWNPGVETDLFRKGNLKEFKEWRRRLMVGVCWAVIIMIGIGLVVFGCVSLFGN